MINLKQFLFEMTESQLRRIYTDINRRAFNNELPPNLKIKVSKTAKRYVGIATAKRWAGKIEDLEIKISDLWTLDEKELYGVMAHEMIHIWFYLNGDFNESHGYKFKAKANEVGKILDIPINDAHVDMSKKEIARDMPSIVALQIITNSNVYCIFLTNASYKKNQNSIDALAQACAKRIAVPIKEIKLLEGQLKTANLYKIQNFEAALKNANFYKMSAAEQQDIDKLSVIKILTHVIHAEKSITLPAYAIVGISTDGEYRAVFLTPNDSALKRKDTILSIVDTIKTFVGVANWQNKIIFDRFEVRAGNSNIAKWTKPQSAKSAIKNPKIYKIGQISDLKREVLEMPLIDTIAP